jgi:hypothetical protein
MLSVDVPRPMRKTVAYIPDASSIGVRTDPLNAKGAVTVMRSTPVKRGNRADPLNSTRADP